MFERWRGQSALMRVKSLPPSGDQAVGLPGVHELSAAGWAAHIVEENMARHSKTREHLETLIEWAGGTSQFEVLTQIRRGDQKQYLAGTKSISMKRRCSRASPVCSSHDRG